MLALLILLLFGLAMAYFATQNTGLVHISLANFLLSGIPLYLIVIGSMALGIFISWLISIVDTISSSITIHGKNTALKEARIAIESLKKENNNLLIENARLKGKLNENQISEETHEEGMERIETRPSFFQRLRHNFT